MIKNKDFIDNYSDNEESEEDEDDEEDIEDKNSHKSLYIPQI